MHYVKFQSFPAPITIPKFNPKFCFLLQITDSAEMLLTRPYLSPGASNPKNKGTFFSSKFKVEEKKVPLFFGLEAPGLRYGLFLIFMITKTQCRTKKMKMLGHPFLMSYRRNKICFGMLMTPVMRIAWVLIQISYFDFFETV